MEEETMEYALKQRVICKQDVGTFTGKIVGHSGDNFIVLLDSSMRDGTEAVLVPSGIVEPLECHWCLDTQKVPTAFFTKGQADDNDIPKVDCPRCTK